MRAVTWQGKRDMRVEEVPDPTIEEPTDAIIRVTTTGLCGSDLHLYEVLGPFMQAGDVVGHEPMGIVEEVGSGVPNLSVGDRVVIPFNVSCGHCWMCEHQLQSQCETTQNRDQGTGPASSDTASSTARCPVGRRSTSGSRTPTTDRSRSPRGRRTTGSCS
jgi:threonine dehydrogenase-like Zn-dependent dehydrogenase